MSYPSFKRYIYDMPKKVLFAGFGLATVATVATMAAAAVNLCV
jgi:hypothetical protein